MLLLQVIALHTTGIVSPPNANSTNASAFGRDKMTPLGYTYRHPKARLAQLRARLPKARFSTLGS